ncbi:hypothetical protein MLD38_001998 [Melastoma candidum]|uniref:Uncharacterized protein n=1 Tax=Melastoma candidum TaxID=119954 RepID=A0ACB9SH06_9MYRT|nr:hypothetical protein MLD38_001998 [Melastoma candidum]
MATRTDDPRPEQEDRGEEEKETDKEETKDKEKKDKEKDKETGKDQDKDKEKEGGNDEGDVPVPPPALQQVPPPEHSVSRSGNKVFKSGPLFLSSKGIGWTSWKKRWFILTRTSLVFFRSDPSAAPQKGGEVNLTLGGIDLNNTGSVVVKADKKLLTVLFPDGRTFTLKAETLEDLNEWKEALEDALSQAPSAALVTGQNGILQNNQSGTADGSPGQLKDKQVAKSMVVGRPILLALEEIDGTPSFLEKALQFMEEHGNKVEGILRQAADVEDVERRIREYEQGNTEFSSSEDPHVIGDCIKYILRELPSSPVPASCCKALLEACRTDRDNRVSAIRMAICETFPEPNRRILQRILIMMRNIASHKAENRMSTSAVAACMAPLLLRPLLAGECELENDFDVGGDGSLQLMQAAAAANHAQAIVIHLLEEYEKIFGESALSPEIYADTEESGTESEDASDYDEDDDDGSYEDDDDDYTQDSETESDNSDEHVQSESASASGETETESADFSHHSGIDGDSIHNDKKADESSSSESPSSEAAVNFDDKQKPSPRIVQRVTSNSSRMPRGDNCSRDPGNDNQTQEYDRPALDADAMNNQAESSQLETLVDQNTKKPTIIASGAAQSMRRPAVWGRAPAKKNLSMESIDLGLDNEVEIERLKAAKIDLQNRVAEETRENELLLTDLERQRKALHERRLALQQDVARLQEQLQKERDLRKALEAGLKIPRGQLPSANIDGKVKADLEDLAQTEADIGKLGQKVNALAEEVDKEQENNRSSPHHLSKEIRQGGEEPRTVVNKEVDGKNASGSHFAKRSITRKNSERVQIENEGVQESTSYSTKPSNQPVDPSKNNLPGKPSSSQVAEPNSGDQSSLPPATSRTSGSRKEEPRSQIANELQNLDKSRDLAPEAQPVSSKNAEPDASKSKQKAET